LVWFSIESIGAFTPFAAFRTFFLLDCKTVNAVEAYDFLLDKSGYATRRMSQTPSSSSRNPASGATHIVRYVRRKGSQNTAKQSHNPECGFLVCSACTTQEILAHPACSANSAINQDEKAKRSASKS
jgi:hypothetical protein